MTGQATRFEKDLVPDAFASPGVSPDTALLNQLRVLGCRCRVMARADFTEACAMLSPDASTAAQSVATVLLRCLPGLLGRRLTLYQPGSTERSFDEDWLLAALSAAARDDTDSLTFLLASRLPKHARRQVGFLLATLSRQLDNAT